MPSMSTEMKMRTVMAAKGIAPDRLVSACNARGCADHAPRRRRVGPGRLRPDRRNDDRRSAHVGARNEGGNTVTRVVDGDTIHVSLDGDDVTIRLIGIDTPETVAPGQPIGCFGPQASAFTTNQLTGEDVILEYDQDLIDPFGRTLAYVWFNGRLFNQT